MKAMEATARISLRNILYATDFSAVADRAVPYAVEIARRYGSKVHGLHVRPLEIYGMAPPESWAILKEAAEEQARQEAKQLSRCFADVPHEAIVTEGDTLDSIFAEVERSHIDLIVVGTHGRKGLQKVFLGSVAENILRRATCPVLTVNPHVPNSPERAIEMKRTLYATSLSSAARLAGAYAVSLAQENQARLDIVHILEPRKAGEAADNAELAECAKQMRAALPPEAALWCDPHVIIEVGDPAEQILNLAKARRADLIVIGVKAASAVPAAAHLPWATAHRIISMAECPVLTVHG